MVLVYGTVGTIDRTAVCEDRDCAQFGELMANHRVIHRPTPERGKKGECPYCHGKLHNWHDADLTVQMQCLWRQAFGDDARNQDANAANLDRVSSLIKGGTISEWANLARVRELTAAAKGLPLAAPRSSATGTTTTAPATGPAPATTTSSGRATASTTVGAASVAPTPAPSVGAGSVTPAPASSSGGRARPAIPADVAARLNAIMGGARVGPA